MRRPHQNWLATGVGRRDRASVACFAGVVLAGALDDIGAQIALIGVPWLMIGEDPSSAPNGGYARLSRTLRTVRNLDDR